MASKKTETGKPETADAPAAAVSLSTLLQRRANRQHFEAWLIGDTPLICHAWSEKARREMLVKQVKALKAAKQARNPEDDFLHSLYDLGDGRYGFPAMAVKNAIVSVAHKDKGLAKTVVQSALWLDHKMVSTRPALAGAICDMPVLIIHGAAPQMREDMVRVGGGLTAKASLAYRGQFSVWALHITGMVNADVIDAAALAFLLADAGSDCGIGEWRTERKGVFGAFHVATPDEAEAWANYVAGKGPLPVPVSYRSAAE